MSSGTLLLLVLIRLMFLFLVLDLALGYYLLETKRGLNGSLLLFLGGFVRFSGDDNLASIKTQFNANSDPSNTTLFNEASLIGRFSTVIAGPLANFIFSVLVFSLILIVQGVPVSDPVIGKINKFYEANYDIKVNDKI